MAEGRVERDSMGEVRVPDGVYYGAQTQRAVENFPISGRPMPASFIRALGLVKRAAAEVNGRLGLLDPVRARAIAEAAREVSEGRWADQFPVDVFQTGSGTSTNMNANEVIARRAEEILEVSGQALRVHPNDHVNSGQSSNDVIPTVLHLSARVALRDGLVPALERLHRALSAQAHALDGIVKIGRTHLQDATPVRLGQEFAGWATQVALSAERARRAGEGLAELALGGTAVGTGLDAPPGFAAATIARLAELTGLELREARDHFEAQGAQDAAVDASGALRTIACSLMKIANDLRLLASGPDGGIGELRLPAVQPGSSIMPGKVNPVICESVTMVAAQVVGNDAAIAVAGLSGQLELNTYLPLIARNLLESIDLLAAACRVLAERCVEGIEADAERCAALVERSIAMATALAPVIGYDRAAEIAKEARASRRTVREVARERSGLSDEELERALDPLRQTGP